MRQASKVRIHFPIYWPDLSETRKNKIEYDLLEKVPYGNTYTKDFASTLVVSEELGKDDFTDVLMVCFTANEHIGNLFGPNSVEMQDVILRLDKEIAQFLTFLDDYVGKENALVFLTSDHGVAQVPAYLMDNRIPVGYFNQTGAVSLLISALNNTYGKGDWIRNYHSGQIYLNHTLIEDSKISLVADAGLCSPVHASVFGCCQYNYSQYASDHQFYRWYLQKNAKQL